MKSRMEKYNETESEYRTRKNKELYKEVGKVDLSQIRTYSNSKVIDNANKQIDMEKIKHYIEKMNENDLETSRKKLNEIVQNFQSEEETNEIKDYDINSVLEKARSKREVNYDEIRSRKLNNSFEEVLKKIEKYTEKYKQEVPDDFNTEEQTLINLINTISINKKDDGLFDDLKGSENTQLIGGIENIMNDENFKEEIKAQISNTFDYHTTSSDLNKTIDDVKEELYKTKEMAKTDIDDAQASTNTFYTTKNSFKEKDFDDETENENEYDSRYEDDTVSSGKTVGIIFATIIIIGIIVVILNYVFDLGLF